MQPSLIIWGEKDQVFPMELAHRLQRYVSLMLPSEFSDKMFQQSTPQLVVLNTIAILSRHLGDNSQIVVVKKAGHAVNLEKDKEVCKNIIEHLQEPVSKDEPGGEKVCIGCFAFT
jgi:pimeloyl-ACP methyl ester carboxylesterase